jgi:Phage Tail Collar Domain
MHNATKQILAGIMVYAMTIGQVFGQAALLPNAEQQYFDNNGNPLASGTVTYYVPGTTTKKTTWQNSGQTINNTNPVNLDVGGKGIMYGQGSYRQVVQDVNGNVIWDQPTTAYGSSSPSGATGTDTAPVGTILPFSGFTLPTNWQLAYGQALSRTTYAQLLAAITIQTTGISCINTSTTLTGFTDTSNIRIGAPIEATCLPTSTTVASITNATTIVVSQAANATLNVTATIFPWGNGDQVSTFNVPDMRGRSAVGADCMGYVAQGNTCAGNLTATYYGSNPGAPGQTGGTQSKNLTIANLNSFTPTGTISTITPSGTITNGAISNILAVQASGAANAGGSAPNVAQNINFSIPIIQAASSFAGNPITPTFTGAALGSGTAHSIVNPDATVNYMIKVTPNTTGAGGVVSFGGMIGDIVCDSTLTCAPVAGINTVACTAATSSQLGCVEPDGSTIQIIGGKITSFAAGTLTDGSSVITSGVNNTVLLNNAGILGHVASSTTVNGQTCALGGTCTVTASASLAVGSSPVTGGSSGFILFNNSGVLGNVSTSGSGSVAFTTSPVFVTPTLGAATATTLNGLTVTSSTGTLTIANSKTLTDTSGIGAVILLGAAGGGFVGYAGSTCTNQAVTAVSSAGAASCNSITNSYLTAGTFSSITGTGTLTAGATGAGFTVALGSSTITGTLGLSNGGTNNTLTASNGGIVWSDASKLNILAGTVTAGQCLLSGSSATPTWGSCSGAAAVSSVTNSDSTLTVSPTTGAVVASLNVAHANTWTAAQTFSAQSSFTPVTTVASASGAVLDDVNVAAETATVTGSTNITTAAGFNKVSIYRPTFTSAGTPTVSTAASLYIANCPLAAGTLTITNCYALNVAAGTANFGGNVNVGVSSLIAGGNAMTFPGSSASLAAYGLAQTWTALQTYSNSDIAMLGSSTGTTTLTSANAGASNFTLTLPAITDTVATVSNIGGAIGAGGRLTLQTNTPVMTTSNSAQTTLRYDCYVGKTVPYYNGTIDQLDTIASCEVTDAMVSAASAGQVVSGQVYDVWWVHGGANRICLAMSSSSGGGGGWASDTGGSNTARGSGYSQLDRTTRPYITNKNSIANCFNGATNYGSVSANQGTYLGTVTASANGQISWTYGTFASGWGAGIFGVWNMYNRVAVSTELGDTASSWTYAVANTWRAPNGNATARVTYVVGLAEDGITATYNAAATAGSATNAVNGIGVDSTTVFSGATGIAQSTALITPTVAAYGGVPGVGLHFISALEFNSSSTSSSWTGTAGTAYLQTGMSVGLRQ